MAYQGEWHSGGVIPLVLLETIFWNTTFRSRSFWSPTCLSTRFCRGFALSLPLRARGGCFVGPGVELVWLAGPAYSADRSSALLNSGETAIVAAVPVGSAPFIGIGSGRSSN